MAAIAADRATSKSGKYWRSCGQFTNIAIVTRTTQLFRSVITPTLGRPFGTSTYAKGQPLKSHPLGAPHYGKQGNLSRSGVGTLLFLANSPDI